MPIQDVPIDRGIPYIPACFKQLPAKNQHHGARKTTRILALTLSLVLVLAIIATSFAASQTTKGRKAEDQCTKDKEALALQIPIHSSQTCNDSRTATVPQTMLPTAGCPSATTNSITSPSETTIFSCVSSVSLWSTTITTCPSSAASTQFSSLPTPVNDCNSLASPYTPNTPGQATATFQIYCTTDYVTPTDMLEIYVYAFEDCINGCASYNWNMPVHQGSVCYAVTWNHSGREASGGNCNFKFQNNGTLVGGGEIDAAVLIQD